MATNPNPAASNGTDPNVQDVSAFVQNLLKEMQSRFQTMSDSIITRIDDMGSRINDLEKSISDLMAQSGVDETSPAGAGGGDARPQ
uniref:Heat shock factor binding protein 1 n=1 Tax=Chromera velia CCMP2878 TaxID=1169474 RepID=A0A0G4I500_9ALVE|mmetsp:Transcript_34762/g.68626  ORF Transcript_34762/g.68626 Transcript_34762/m.68626 type:complete len:86 (-) Transcript_34762:324-581(-)|eukprot:Cvel_11051.t1-p1 / transcript=Cvel_11051.t1 / gene=Cvel_11051 / organism=Chromera_velia_CCMP2878 / gene_product=Heat shock factor-binding protein 1, putative / transcript_product=Heat shock factor-binding protein 1, putative / location=Cvel_scaffold681:46735-47292(-) / protein_length=85 / sequence_SO=supercontig / SO=protein_coding / is_pseudo=false